MEINEFRELNRQKAGKKAKANGDAAESLIKTICLEYERLGIARLEKVDPPTRFIGKKRIIYLQNPFLDLVGSWKGKAVFLEVKSTQAERLTVNRSNGVKESQINSLRHWANFGALTGVLWVRQGVIKTITTETLEHVRESGKASISWNHLRTCRSGGTPLLLFDFLEELAG